MGRVLMGETIQAFSGLQFFIKCLQIEHKWDKGKSPSEPRQ